MNKSQPLKNIITDEDINWFKYSENSNRVNTTGDERLAYKSAHSARKFKQNMIYAARRSNANTWKKHIEPELKFHASRYGWWEEEKNEPIIYPIKK